MRYFAAAVVVTGLVALGAADDDRNDRPPRVTDLTGHWRGHVSDSFGRGNMTWDIVQSGSSVSGEMRGSVTGTLEGATLSFTITIVRGQCSITARGTARVTNNLIVGTHSGTSCDGAITNGELYLAREVPNGNA
jgi:hypothetical protein